MHANCDRRAYIGQVTVQSPGHSGLAPGQRVTFDVLSMQGKTLVGQDAEPVMAAVAELVGEGALVQVDLPGVVAAEVLSEHLTIDLRDGVDAAPLISLVVSAGIQVEEVRRSKASLEEVFLTLMEEER